MLKDEDLLQISGGGFGNIAAVVIGVVTFLAGLVDGFVRPYKCR